MTLAVPEDERNKTNRVPNLRQIEHAIDTAKYSKSGLLRADAIENLHTRFSNPKSKYVLDIII
jgi:hypothetical protein